MKKFRLEYERTEVYVTKYEVHVEAETENEAKDIVEEQLDNVGTDALTELTYYPEKDWPVESELQFKRISEL